MGIRIQFPLYKLFIVVAIYALFFRLWQLNPDAGDMTMPAICATTVSLYYLFRRSALMTVSLVGIVGAVVGFSCGSGHYLNEQLDVTKALTSAFIGAVIGVFVGLTVIRSRMSAIPTNSADQTVPPPNSAQPGASPLSSE
jgi:ABC-type nitrate/sulfonate/bicarbonate transport system permease component